MECEKVQGNEFYGSSFPRSFFNYMAQPSNTQVLALPARSEQCGLFLTRNDWTYCKLNSKPIDRICTIIRTRPLITDTQTNTLDLS